MLRLLTINTEVAEKVVVPVDTKSTTTKVTEGAANAGDSASQYAPPTHFPNYCSYH